MFNIGFMLFSWVVYLLFIIANKYAIAFLRIKYFFIMAELQWFAIPIRQIKKYKKKVSYLLTE